MRGATGSGRRTRVLAATTASLGARQAELVGELRLDGGTNTGRGRRAAGVRTFRHRGGVYPGRVDQGGGKIGGAVVATAGRLRQGG